MIAHFEFGNGEKEFVCMFSDTSKNSQYLLEILFILYLGHHQRIIFVLAPQTFF